MDIYIYGYIYGYQIVSRYLIKVGPGPSPEVGKVVLDKQNQNDPGIHGKVPVVAIQTELLRQAK